MKIISISSLKGGSGKTTLAIFLSQLLAKKGRVLAIDLDHNNNLTDYFLRNTGAGQIERANVYHVITGKKEAKDCIYPAEFLEKSTHLSGAHLDVLPATVTLSRIGNELSRDPGSLLRFAPVLKSLPYDFAILDTPPALSYELTLALYSANLVLSPVSYSRWTVQGCAMLREELETVQKTTGRNLPLFAVPVMISNGQAKKLKISGIQSLTESAIHKSSAVKNACDTGSSLKEKSKSYLEFESLLEEVLV